MQDEWRLKKSLFKVNGYLCWKEEMNYQNLISVYSENTLHIKKEKPKAEKVNPTLNFRPISIHCPL